jgi:hypothetical protein
MSATIVRLCRAASTSCSGAWHCAARIRGPGDSYVPSTFQFESRYPEVELYAQDTWKMRKNLTVDLGLRWEARFAPTDPQSRMLVPNQPIVAGAAPSNTIRWVAGDMFKSQLTNFGPSAGFAWDPFGDGKTSIRANYRLAFDRISTFLLASQIFPNLPGGHWPSTTPTTDRAAAACGACLHSRRRPFKPSDLTQPAAFSTSSQAAIDPNMKTPTTHQWSFSVQRQVMKDTVLDVTYVGRRAYHLLGGYNVNQAILFQNGFADAFRVVQNGGDSPLINNLVRSDTRLNPGETGSQMVRRLYTTQLQQKPRWRRSPMRFGSRLQNGRSVPSLSTGNAFALHPFPQYLGGVRVFDSNDYSTYHALELRVGKNFSKGVTLHFAYTFSKALDTRSWDPSEFQRDYGIVSGGRFDAVRHLQSQPELRGVRFRPAARNPVRLGDRASLRARQEVRRKRRRRGGPRDRRMAGVWPGAVDERASVHGVLRLEYIQQRGADAGFVRRMQPRHRQHVLRCAVGAGVVLQRSGSGEILDPGVRKSGQHPAQFLSHLALFRCRHGAAEADPDSRAVESGNSRRTPPTCRIRCRSTTDSGLHFVALRTDSQQRDQRVEEVSVRRED